MFGRLRALGLLQFAVDACLGRFFWNVVSEGVNRARFGAARDRAGVRQKVGNRH